ncbi:hypothetical protein MBLNU230_g6114t1 [Neophaeotheca triangularis]
MPPICPPPSLHHTTHPLPPSTAQTTLSTFLTRSQKQPHLHPDSILSSSGISFSATAGTNGGLALHHLRRIEAGLRGESLVAETREELARFTGEDLGDLLGGDEERREKKPLKSSLKRRREERVDSWDDGAGVSGREEVEGWQDKEVFDRQQRVVEGEVGEREGAPVVREGEGPPVLEEHDDEGRVDKRAKTEKEKAARKAAKKARNKAMQAEKKKG